MIRNKTYYRTLAAMLLMAVLSVLFSCSTTSSLPDGEYLYTGIKSVRIHDELGTDDESTALTEVRAALDYEPNNAFFGSSSVRTPLPVGLWLYNSLASNHKGFLRKWLFNSFAKPPRTVSMANPVMRTKVATSILQNYGYFQGRVDYSIVEQKNPRKQKISYDIHLGQPYYIDTIRYDFPLQQDSIIRASEDEPYIQNGKQFSVADLQEERSRINTALRNQGYYFYRPDYVSYFADSINDPGFVTLLVTPDRSMPERAARQWRFGRIHAYIRNASGGYSMQYDSVLHLPRIDVSFQGKRVPVKPTVMFRNFKFWTGMLYSQDRVTATVTALNNMGVFNGVHFTFTPTDSTEECNTLDVRLETTMSKPYDAELAFNVTQKSNSQVGPNLELGLTRRNAFHLGESLTFRLKGSYEWQTQRTQGVKSRVNSYEYGAEAGITFPWLAFPGWQNRFSRYPSTSTFKYTFNDLNRANYYHMQSLGIHAEYVYQNHKYISHRITPLTVVYNKLRSTSERFDTIVNKNMALYYSLRNQFIPAIQYTFAFDNHINKRRKFRSSAEFTIKESGNIISAIKAATGEKFTKENKTLLGSPYSQFLKFDLTLRSNYYFSPKLSLATRFLLGTAWSYGNSSIAPYNELFYVGGANSIRAFGVRSIGPGRYYDYEGRNTYLDQSGDFKLEANAELRFSLVGSLSGAVFVDAGNVWLLRPDDSHPGGTLNPRHFLNDIALGTGFGVRYDLSFLVLRLDLGVGIHAPYDTGKRGYYNIPRFWDGLGLHFAVGYPF